MRIWRVKKLAVEFRENNVSEKQQFSYFLLLTVLITILLDDYIVSVLGLNEINENDKWSFSISLVSSFLGTIWCFSSYNSDSDGAGFISRYLCLGLPISVQMLVVYSVLLGAVVFGNSLIEEITIVDTYFETEGSTRFDVAVFLLLEVSFFVYLKQAISWSYEKT